MVDWRRTFLSLDNKNGNTGVQVIFECVVNGSAPGVNSVIVNLNSSWRTAWVSEISQTVLQVSQQSFCLFLESFWVEDSPFANLWHVHEILDFSVKLRGPNQINLSIVVDDVGNGLFGAAQLEVSFG
mgnify:CR=1 FL=1